MKKKIILTLSMVILVIVLTSSSILAGKPPGEDPSPIDSVWAEIGRLWDAINNIELTQGPQGEPGRDGTPGTNGISIIWLGTLTTAPYSPTLNNAYHNSTDKKSYIWDGDSWEILAQDGTSSSGGSQGTPIIWSGGSTTWGNPGVWEAYRTDGVDFNTASGYISTTGDGYFSVTTPGFYRINAQVTGWGDGGAYAIFKVNGIQVDVVENFDELQNTTTVRNIGLDLTWPLNAGDTFCVIFSFPGHGYYPLHRLDWEPGSRLQVSYEGPLP